MAKTITGVVASDKGDKTIVVKIQSSKTHPIYKKQYFVNKKIMAHDEKNEANTGDKVVIEETKPISARKRFRLKKIIGRAGIEHVEDVTPSVIAENIEPEKKAKNKPAEAKEDKK